MHELNVFSWLLDLVLWWPPEIKVIFVILLYWLTSNSSMFAMENRLVVTAEQPVCFLPSLSPRSGPLRTHPTLVLTAQGLPAWLLISSHGSITSDALVPMSKSMSESISWSLMSLKYGHGSTSCCVGILSFVTGIHFCMKTFVNLLKSFLPSPETDKPDMTWLSTVFFWPIVLNRMRVLRLLAISLWARLFVQNAPELLGSKKA